MKTAIRKIFNKHCTLMNKDYNDYVIRKPNEFIKEIAGLFASLNLERVIAYEFYCPSTGHCYVDYIHRSDIEAPGKEYMQRPLGYISDLCSGSQEKEQKSFDGMEYHNTCSFD